MSRWLIFVLAVVAWSALALAQQPKPSATAAEARIAVEPVSFDFGSALQNKTLTKEFVVRNFGSTDLVIESVSTTCGCTVGQLDTRRIKPGMSVPLRVSLETRTYSGPLRRAVLIRSNDTAKGLLEIRVLANVQRAAPGK